MIRNDEQTFGPLWPFIKNEKITDVKWNGNSLYINHLDKGRYLANSQGEKWKEGDEFFKLEKDFVDIFTQKISNDVNKNFNVSEPSLNAETDYLRIQAEHESISGDHTACIAIRKTPPVARLLEQDLIANGYMHPLVHKLIPCLMRGHCSGVITGDVGSGKTELEKYMIGFIPDNEGMCTVEDTLEMKIRQIYPLKDCFAMKITDKGFTAEQAIRDALRLNTKWLILAEARGREISRVMEGASTGCVALVTIHCENVEDIPDRIQNMTPDGTRDGFKNDVFTFFDFAIKVKCVFTDHGIVRSVDQICFFDRQNEKNSTYIFMKNGKIDPTQIPPALIEKFKYNKENEFLNFLEEAKKGKMSLQTGDIEHYPNFKAPNNIENKKEEVIPQKEKKPLNEPKNDLKQDEPEQKVSIEQRVMEKKEHRIHINKDFLLTLKKGDQIFTENVKGGKLLTKVIKQDGTVIVPSNNVIFPNKQEINNNVNRNQNNSWSNSDQKQNVQPKEEVKPVQDVPQKEPVVKPIQDVSQKETISQELESPKRPIFAETSNDLEEVIPSNVEETAKNVKKDVEQTTNIVEEIELEPVQPIFKENVIKREVNSLSFIQRGDLIKTKDTEKGKRIVEIKKPDGQIIELTNELYLPNRR